MSETCPSSGEPDVRPAIVVIVGPTASGKTDLAVALAERFGGEIVNADSRQVYRGMDIGTAKPSPAVRARIPHHLVDIRNPDEPFSLHDFLVLADAAIRDICRRGRLPFVVGGTGQYVWALVEGWHAPPVAPDPELRAELAARAAREGAATLHAELAALDPAAAQSIDPRNVRRVIRALEVIHVTGRLFSAQRRRAGAPYRTLVLGLRLSRETLYRRIDRRVEVMFASGLVDEVQRLLAAGYGCDLPALRSIGYAEVCSYLRGDRTLAEAIAQTKIATHRLARMQANWFRASDPRIHWLDAETGPPVAEAAELVRRFRSGEPL